MDSAEREKWNAERDAQDDALYERFGAPLEPDHTGKLSR